MENMIRRKISSIRDNIYRLSIDILSRQNSINELQYEINVLKLQLDLENETLQCLKSKLKEVDND